MGIFLCLLDLFVHLICTCCSLTGCSFQLFLFSQYFFQFQIRSSFSSLKQDISVLERGEEIDTEIIVFHQAFPTFPGATGYWRVLFGIQQLAVLSSASETLPSFTLPVSSSVFEIQFYLPAIPIETAADTRQKCTALAFLHKTWQPACSQAIV